MEQLDADTIKQLLSPLKGLPFSVLGGAGLALAGLPRRTADIDVMVAPEDLKNAVARMRQAGRSVEPIGNEAMQGFSTTPTDGSGWIVDILAPAEQHQDWAQEMLFESPGDAPAKPWLMATKLVAMREKDMDDAISLWEAMSPQERQQVERIIKKHMPWAAEDLESISMMQEAMAFASSDLRIVRAWIARNCRISRQ